MNPVKPLLVIALTCSALLSAAAPAFAGLDLYGIVARHDWKQTGSSAESDTERGGLLGIGIAGRFVPPAPSILSIGARFEGYGGEVDYDNPDVRSTSDISGAKLEGDLGMLLRLPGVTIEPFAGVGYRWWNRDLYYVDQDWQDTYGRVGLRFRHSLPMSPVRVFAEAGARIPLTTRVSVTDPDGFRHAVRPGKKTSAFAEAGISLSSFKASLFYEGIRYGKSDPVLDIEEFISDSSGAIRTLTGDVSYDILGLKFGISF